MENWQLVFPLRQWSGTPIGFGQRFLRLHRDNTESIRHTFQPVSSWFLPVSSTETNMEGMKFLRCYWHHWEFERRAETGFRKWLPGMLPTPLQSLAEVYIFTRGLYSKESSLNDYTAFYFSEIKWFRGYFEVTMHIIRSWIISRSKRNEICRIKLLWVVKKRRINQYYEWRIHAVPG